MDRIALIPARSGSKRVPDKNIRELDGIPLIGHTIRPALESGLFSEVIVVTDSDRYAGIAKELGVDNVQIRPPQTATDTAPDIAWVTWIDSRLENEGLESGMYFILRPTSPFRTVSTLMRANKVFEEAKSADTLRAVQKVSEHPGKMWVRKADQIVPLLPFARADEFWHNSQTNTLPEIFVQNASLEILHKTNIKNYGSITGSSIVPFFTEGLEGFDINTEDDFFRAKLLVERAQK